MAQLSFARALAILAGTPPVLSAIVSNLPHSAQDQRAAEGAWSPRDVLAHLLHAEQTGMGPRVKRAVQEDRHPYQQASPPPTPGDTHDMFKEWADVREENLKWLGELTPEQRAHIVLDPRYGDGEIAVETYVAEWAYHDLDHLRQILAVLAADLWPHIGPFHRLYTPPA